MASIILASIDLLLQLEAFLSSDNPLTLTTMRLSNGSLIRLLELPIVEQDDTLWTDLPCSHVGVD